MEMSLMSSMLLLLTFRTERDSCKKSKKIDKTKMFSLCFGTYVDIRENMRWHLSLFMLSCDSFGLGIYIRRLYMLR